MKVNIFYATAPGRLLLKGIMKSGALPLAAGFLRSFASKVLIKPYILRNRIEMHDFRGQKYRSFADFFARKRDWTECCGTAENLISPCDGGLSIFPVKKNSEFVVKDSRYRVSDLITDEATAARFAGGFCLIYRLEASDYHHFCYIDDCYHGEAHHIDGMLHSVQPIACSREPVYRLNRRTWSLMETRHFGLVAQVEIGALLVGGIVHENQNCWTERGDEMGHFELAGSTIIQFFTKNTRKSLKLLSKYRPAFLGKSEIRVRQGQIVGVIVK